MGKKNTTNTQTTNTVSPYSQGLINTATNNARGHLNANPFQTYDGQRVSGLNQAQTDARQQFQQGQGAGNANIDSASGIAGNAGNFQPGQVNAQSFRDADLSAYTNPHEQAVIDASMRDIERQRQGAINSNADRASAAGAFGGSRHGVTEAETNRAFGDIGARTVAGLRSDGFNRAAGLFQNDANRQLQADTTNANLGIAGQNLNLQGAGLLGQLGQYQNENNRADASLANLFGSQEQQLEQAGLDAQYQEFLRAQDDPFRRAQVEMGLLGGAPVVTNSSGTQTQQSNPGFAGILGTGLSLFSDRRLKRDIKPLGKRGGHKWYSFKYLWSDKTEEGVMADEVKRTNPELVTRHSSGFDMVNYAGIV